MDPLRQERVICYLERTMVLFLEAEVLFYPDLIDAPEDMDGPYTAAIKAIIEDMKVAIPAQKLWLQIPSPNSGPKHWPKIPAPNSGPKIQPKFRRQTPSPNSGPKFWS